LGPVLGDVQADLGEIEDLTGLGVHHLGTFEARAARCARRRCVGDHQIGVRPLGQMLAWGTGLFALLLGRRPTFGPGRRRWLGEQLGRRRHRRVAGIAVETLTQIGHLGSQCGDLRCLGRH
jgi:hypothetical protein